MSFELPDLSGTPCDGLSICGRIKDSPIASQVKPLEMVASYTRSRKKHFIRLLKEPADHLHIDVALRTRFKGGPPTLTATREDIKNAVAPLLGLESRIRVQAYFRLNMADLPENGFIQSISVKTSADGVTLTQIGGRFSLTGSAVQEIRWNRMNDEIIIAVIAARQEQINESYLTRNLEWISSLFNRTALLKP